MGERFPKRVRRDGAHPLTFVSNHDRREPAQAPADDFDAITTTGGRRLARSGFRSCLRSIFAVRWRPARRASRPLWIRQRKTISGPAGRRAAEDTGGEDRSQVWPLLFAFVLQLNRDEDGTELLINLVFDVVLAVARWRSRMRRTASLSAPRRSPAVASFASSKRFSFSARLPIRAMSTCPATR